MSSTIKVLLSKRTAEQAKRALTLKGRRLWCRCCHWFGHWGGWEGIFRGCAEGIGDLWAQGADTLCFPFYFWHCKTNGKWLQEEQLNNPEIWQYDTRWHFIQHPLLVKGKVSTVRWGYKNSFKIFTGSISLTFQTRRYKVSAIHVRRTIFIPWKFQDFVISSPGWHCWEAGVLFVPRCSVS